MNDGPSPHPVPSPGTSPASSPAFPAPLADSGAGVIAVPDARRTRDWSLVLGSQQIAHAVHGTPTGWILLVDGRDLARAREAIRLYETENRNWPPRAVRERLPYARSLVAPLVLAALAAFFVITGPVADQSAWFTRGASSSQLVLHGQPWRAVTALTLHADAVHIAGNALSGAVFLSALQRRLGGGRAVLLAVVSGTVGNLLNAAWHRTGHVSIGASTAVFAAVGLLVATQLAFDRRVGHRRWTERVGPIVGGLALLGWMGASPHSDLLAHLFGLLAGVAIGLPVAIAARGRPSSPWAQWLAGLGALGMVVGAWALAWR